MQGRDVKHINDKFVRFMAKQTGIHKILIMRLGFPVSKFGETLIKNLKLNV